MRFGGLFVGLIFCGCQKDNVLSKKENFLPSITIQSHSDGSVFQSAVKQSFRAQVSDDNDPFESLSVAWYIGENIYCDWEQVSPAGESFCELEFAVGDDRVVASVRDPQGGGGQDEVSISVLATGAPEAEILSPLQSGNYYSDQLIQFSALIADQEDETSELLVEWRSSVDDLLDLDTEAQSSGEISDFTYLSEGQHAIELRVEDSSGKVTTDEVVITVGGENTLPACSIDEPLDSTVVVVGTVVTFRGQATDVDISNNELQIEWSSDKDGSLGQMNPTSAGEVNYAYADLSPNTHTITMTVTDEVGGVCSDSIFLVVGTPPSVVIDSPTDGLVYSLGESVGFHATVADNEDILNNLGISWQSSIDGVLHTQPATSQGESQFSSSALSAGVHSISLTVTDSGGLSADDMISVRINTPPPAPSVVITPSVAQTNDVLSVSASAAADADGDAVTYSYEWFENGALQNNTTTSIPASDTDYGEVWLVRVTPNDGYVDGAYTEASIVIANTTPQVDSIAISPSAGAFNDDTLTCSANVSDADESVSATYTWQVNGVSFVGATLDLTTSSAMPGDVVNCTATVTDSAGASASDNTSLVIMNRNPSVTGVVVTPSTVRTDTELLCSANVSDDDGEGLSISYQWDVGGVTVSTNDSLQLDNILVSPTDSVSCSVTVTDASGASATGSSMVTVENSPPSIVSLSLNPIEPRIDDELTCQASATDADGETPNLNFVFRNSVTGTVYAATNSGLQQAGLDLSSLSLQYGDMITCEVTATDSYGDSASQEVEVTILNTAPVFDVAAAIAPAQAYTGTNLTCSAIANDPDDGPIQPLYTWLVNGVSIATGTNYTVLTADTNVGDSLTCRAIATDADGETTTSDASVTILNTSPALSNMSLSPTVAYNDSNLSCSANVTDPDEALSIDYQWLENGVAMSTGQTLDLGQISVSYQDTITCLVSVTDSQGASDAASQSITIDNRPPGAPGISLTPTNPVEQVDDLLCSVNISSSDADGDSVSYSFTWTVDGNIFSGATDIVTMSTVSAADTNTGEDWVCQVTPNDGIDDGSIATTSVTIQSDWDGVRLFDSCGQTGRNGPSQSLCDSSYQGSTLEGEVTVSNGYQLWTVPTTGTYAIEVLGAEGGDSNREGFEPGGKGASVYGEFFLTEGDELKIVVGQEGGTNTCGGGGGGGSFVTYSNDTPLIVAGGGGGAMSCNYNQGVGGAGYDGQGNDTCGTNGGYGECSNYAPAAELGGCNGEGGESDYDDGGSYGGGGGGLYTDGQSVSNNMQGIAFVNGGTGGNSTNSSGDIGGFGGGGGSWDGCCGGAGGGGGYSGGGSGNECSPGGGGGSYNSGSNQQGISGINSGHGQVSIDRL